MAEPNPETPPKVVLFSGHMIVAPGPEEFFAFRGKKYRTRLLARAPRGAGFKRQPG